MTSSRREEYAAGFSGSNMKASRGINKSLIVIPASRVLPKLRAINNVILISSGPPPGGEEPVTPGRGELVVYIARGAQQLVAIVTTLAVTTPGYEPCCNLPPSMMENGDISCGQILTH